MVKTFVVRHRGEMRDSMGMEGKGTVCREENWDGQAQARDDYDILI